MERFRPGGREGGAERESQWREKGILKSQGDRLKDGIYYCKECHRLCIFRIYTTLHSCTWYLQALGNRLQYCIYTRKWVDSDNFFNSWVQNRKGKRLLRLWKLEEKSQPMSCACKCFAGWCLQRALSCHRRFFECLGSEILLPESWCTLIDVSERNVWTPSAETKCWCTTYSMMSELEVGNKSTKDICWRCMRPLLIFFKSQATQLWATHRKQHVRQSFHVHGLVSGCWGVPVLDCIGPPAFPENVPLTVSSNCIIPNEMLVYVVVRFFTHIFDSVPVRCHDWNLKVWSFIL